MMPSKPTTSLREEEIVINPPRPARRVVLSESTMDVLRRSYLREDGAGEPPKTHKIADTNGRTLLAFLTSGIFDRLKFPPAKVLEMIGGGDATKGMTMFIANVDKMSRLAKGSGKPPRRDMPVIHPKDIAAFTKRLKAGEIDIVKPHATAPASRQLPAPRREASFDPQAIDLSGGRGQPKPPTQYFIRGRMDAVKKDDVVMGIKEAAMSVGKLKPSQDEIYGSKVCFNMCNFGPTVGGSTAFGKADIIVTSDNFILDGHHRWATAYAAHTSNKIRVTVIPLPFKHLYLVMRSYGAAIGNKQQA
jgi:hypothetical protein